MLLLEGGRVMLPALVITLAVSYLLLFLITLAVVRVAIPERGVLLLLVVLSLSVPIITAWALIKSLIGKPEPLRYSEELGRIEDEIEAERVRIFGGNSVSPSLSEHWKAAYLQHLATTATKVERLVGSHHQSSLFQSGCSVR